MRQQGKNCFSFSFVDFLKSTSLSEMEQKPSKQSPSSMDVEVEIDQEIQQFKSQNSTTHFQQEKKSNSNALSHMLGPYVLHPEKHPEQVLEFNEKLVCIYDKYPKAKFHFLVMPRESLNFFSQLNENHLPLLETIYEKGKEIATKFVFLKFFILHLDF